MFGAASVVALTKCGNEPPRAPTTRVSDANAGSGADAGAGEDALGNIGTDSASADASPPCTVRPAQTEGPYFVDEMLNRSDIRSDPTDGTTKPGALLRITFRVLRIGGSACTPLSDALVDIWQCDALGAYSDVQDSNGHFDTRGKKFLRGYQLTDQNGLAEFVTIYPGWYSGRTAHIHFKVRTNPSSPQGHVFTSQLYFDDTITDVVFAQAPYNSKGPRSTTNAMDGIFQSGGKQLVLNVAPDAQGYAGTFEVGLAIA